MNDPSDEEEAALRAAARRMRYPPTPPIAERVRLPRRPAPHRPLRVALAVCLLLVVIGTATVSGVRAGVKPFLQIGAVRLWLTPPKSVIDIPFSHAPLGMPTTLAEAQAQVGYPIRLPTYPAALGAPNEVFMLNAEESSLLLVWHATPQHPELRLTQHGAGFWVQKWGPTNWTSSGVVVGEDYALWAEGPHRWAFRGAGGDRAVSIPKGHAVLIWVDAGVTYRLESTLPQADAVQVAESLQ